MDYHGLFKTYQGLFMDYHGVRWATMASSQTTTMDYRGLFMNYHVLWFMDYHGLQLVTMNCHGGQWTVRELTSIVARGSSW